MTHTEQLFSVHTQTRMLSHRFKWRPLSPARKRKSDSLSWRCSADWSAPFTMHQGVQGLVLVFYWVDFVKKLTTFHTRFIVQQSPPHPNWFFTWNMTCGFHPRSSRWFKCNWQVLRWSGNSFPLDCCSCLMNLHTPPPSARSSLSSHLFNSSPVFPSSTHHLFALISPLLAPLLSHLHIPPSRSHGKLDCELSTQKHCRK